MKAGTGFQPAVVDAAELRNVLLGLLACLVVMSSIVIASQWFLAKKDAESAASVRTRVPVAVNPKEPMASVGSRRSIEITKSMLDSINTAMSSGDYSQIAQVFASVTPETIDETKMLLQSVDYDLSSLRASEMAGLKMHSD